jgi:hypothetical protein
MHASTWTKRPLLVATAAYVAAILLIAPWGDFPINDDWQYAHLALNWSRTGTWKVDTDTAPSVIAQAAFALPWIRLFGFSHTLLRCLTILTGWTGLAAISFLLKRMATGDRARSLALLVVVFNPFYLYFSTTYMTEMYGYVLALAGAALWFGSSRPVPSWKTAIGSAFLIGTTFWIRQFCVTVFPAMLGAWAYGLYARGQKAELLAARYKIVAVTAVVAGAIALYGTCAWFGGWNSAALATPLAKLRSFDPLIWAYQPGFFIQYLSWFLAPLLFLFPWRGLPSRRALKTGAILFVTLGISLGFVWLHKSYSATWGFFNRDFPHLRNVLSRAGIGPHLVSDLRIYGFADPLEFPAWLWRAVELAVTAACAHWIAVIASVGDKRKPPWGKPDTLAFFGAAFTACSTLLVWQAYGLEVFDRYYFPGFLGGLLFLASRIDSLELARRRGALFALALLPLAVYSVGSLHDQFRFQAAAWALLDEAIRAGASPGNVEGGYEMDGWSYFESPRSPLLCEGACGCDKVWWQCLDATYRIGMHVLPGYEEIKRSVPAYWLTDGAPLILSRRSPLPVALRNPGT